MSPPTYTAQPVSISDSPQDYESGQGATGENYHPGLLATLVRLNAQTPAFLGDQDHSTGVYDNVSNPSPYAASVKATAMVDPANPPFAPSGSVSSVKFFATGGIFIGLSGDPSAGATNFLMKWKVGAVTDSAVPTGTWPQITDLLLPDALGMMETAAITTKPGGGAWTWQDIADLVDVEITCDVVFEDPTGVAHYAAEIYAEVTGEIGPVGEPIQIVKKLLVADIRSTGGAGEINPAGKAGSLVKTLKVPRRAIVVTKRRP